MLTNAYKYITPKNVRSIVLCIWSTLGNKVLLNDDRVFNFSRKQLNVIIKVVVNSAAFY